MYCFCNQRDNASGWLNVVEILLNDHILKMPFRGKKTCCCSLAAGKVV